MISPLFINHLWQSSCFALVAGLLTFVLRRHSPKVRYWVWLSASLKFLIPFALLVSLGSVVPRPARHPLSVAAPVFPDTLVQIAEPFSPILKVPVPVSAPLHWAPIAIGVVWALGFLIITLARWRGWLRIRAALRGGTPIELPIPVRALITSGTVEPGIVGFLHPVLVLPAQLLERLNPRQLGAILTHELCHVRRRDNFFAAVQMLVEAVFWFHPLVWWIGSRMVEERELACDEEVLRMGCDPADYVEGILKVCRFYAESPLPCVSGVTGADVKKRLRSILSGSIARELNGVKRLALTTIGLAALTVPVLIGMLNAPAIRAQNSPAVASKFEVASVRPTSSTDGRALLQATPGRLALRNLAPRRLILIAYDIQDTQLAGDPSWIDSDHYDIVAKADGNPSVQQMEGPMLRALLEERFRLALHRETRQLPVYKLSVGKSGPKFQPTKEGSCTPYVTSAPPPITRQGEPLPNLCGFRRTAADPANRILDGQGITMSYLATTLSRTYISTLGRNVIDGTGLTGMFDIYLKWAIDPPTTTPGDAGNATPPDLAGPSIFTAVQEQLGLTLEPTKGPVEVLVIDHIEKPSGN